MAHHITSEILARHGTTIPTLVGFTFLGDSPQIAEVENIDDVIMRNSPDELQAAIQNILAAKRSEVVLIAVPSYAATFETQEELDAAMAANDGKRDLAAKEAIMFAIYDKTGRVNTQVAFVEENNQLGPFEHVAGFSANTEMASTIISDLRAPASATLH